jgi:hypothetical protein
VVFVSWRAYIILLNNKTSAQVVYTETCIMRVRIHVYAHNQHWIMTMTAINCDRLVTPFVFLTLLSGLENWRLCWWWHTSCSIYCISLKGIDGRRLIRHRWFTCNYWTEFCISPYVVQEYKLSILYLYSCCSLCKLERTFKKFYKLIRCKAGKNKFDISDVEHFSVQCAVHDYK